MSLAAFPAQYVPQVGNGLTAASEDIFTMVHFVAEPDLAKCDANCDDTKEQDVMFRSKAGRSVPMWRDSDGPSVPRLPALLIKTAWL
mmetsp:Transcript_6165/g.12913  ORF Transcript_6165/g.12913 Transcript_6165/m.12913 type:complete len:87 (+) Transcript_6165:459-719(+)